MSVSVPVRPAVRRVSGRRGGAGEFEALSSDGHTRYYLPVDSHLRVACDPKCKGFMFRRTCAHEQAVSKALIDEIQSAGIYPVVDSRPSAPSMARPKTSDPLVVEEIEDPAWAEAYV